MNNSKIFKTIITSLMISLVCVVTMMFQIPMIGTNGFINIGDSIIFIASAIFGPVVGMLAGSLGSALADMLSGYAHWAAFTFVIKGLEGLVAGIIIKKYYSKLSTILGCFVGTIVMVTGYFIAGAILKGSFIISLESVIPNFLQGMVSTVISISVISAMIKTTYFKKNILNE